MGKLSRTLLGASLSLVLGWGSAATGQEAPAKSAAPAKPAQKAKAANPNANDAIVPRPRDEKWMLRHEAITKNAKLGNIDLMFLGDSITQGWSNNEIWKKHYGARKALNAGIGGDRTQHVLWRLDHGNLDNIQPKLVVLMIGTNNSGANSPEQIAEGVKAVVAKLREKRPEAKILLLAIFPRGADSQDAKRRTNEKANAIFAKVADGKHVHFLDIGPKFLREDGTLDKAIMPDLLHLSKEGYRIWAEAIEEKVAELLGEKK